MRPWLLLVSLLVSHLSPPGDGDWVGVMENHSRRLRGKLLLGGQMTLRGLRILPTQTEHRCTCSRTNCVHVAVRHKQRTPPFYWATGDDHGRRLAYQEPTGRMPRSHSPAQVRSFQVVFLLREEGKREKVPAFLLKSDTFPALQVISELTPTEAGGESSHIAMGIVKDQPDSGSAWFLHQHTATSGHNFQAFLLEKSKSWAATTIALLQKMLTKRYCAAKTVIISCCFEESETRSALKIKKISKEQSTESQRRQKESSQRKVGVNVHPPTAAVGQRDIFQAATLHPGSSSVKTADTSQLQMQSEAARIRKKDEHLNLDEESFVQNRVQRQQSLKAASDVYDGGDDGFYVERRRLLVSREKTESIQRLQDKKRANQDDNKGDFSGKIITKQAELRRPEGERQTERPQTNTIVNGNQKRLAHILQVGFTHKTDYNDHKQTEAAEEVLFLPDTEKETQTEPPLERKPVVHTDTGWKTLDDPPPTAKAKQENLIIKPENWKRLRESSLSLGRYLPNRTERIDIKPAERTAKVPPVSAHTEEQVEETTETVDTPRETMSINQTKQEESASVLPSPPSLIMVQTGAAEPAETKQVTWRADVFNPGSTVSPEPTSTTCKPTKGRQTTTEKSFSGLRMRENLPAEAAELLRGTESEDRAATNRPETGRQETKDPKPPQTLQDQTTDELPETTDDSPPLCGGLVHRTEAGWKYCVERFARTGSRDRTDVFKDTGEPRNERTPLRDDEEGYEHFYYFDGVLRQVQSHFYPSDTRQRR